MVSFDHFPAFSTGLEAGRNKFRSPGQAASFRVEERRDDFPCFLARHHRHDLEGHAEALAIQDPFLQQPRIWHMVGEVKSWRA